jgi:putative flippase GtrA
VADTGDVRIQFFRYLFVGGLAFVVDFGTLWLLTSRFGLHYLLSAAFAFLAGLAVNYLLSIAWVFKERRMSSRREEFLGFGAIGLAGLGFNEAGMWLLCGLAGLDYRLAKIVTTAVVFLWNFGARKMMLFRARALSGRRGPGAGG